MILSEQNIVCRNVRLDDSPNYVAVLPACLLRIVFFALSSDCFNRLAN